MKPINGSTFLLPSSFLSSPSLLSPFSSYTDGIGPGWGCDEVGMSGRRPSCGAAVHCRGRAAALRGGGRNGRRHDRHGKAAALCGGERNGRQPSCSAVAHCWARAGVSAVLLGKEWMAARRAWAIDGEGGGTVGSGRRRARRARAEALEVLAFLNVVTWIVSP